MDSLSFWDIYCPVLAALISSVVVFEAFQFGLSYIFAKRQMKKYEEFQKKVASGEITPEMMNPMMPGMMGPQGGFPFDLYPPTTASGNDPNFGGSGQYL